jgi:hypothetical protein
MASQSQLFIFEEIFPLLREQIISEVQIIMQQADVPSQSKLINSIDVEFESNAIRIIANDYYEYLSRGRRPLARKVPIQALLRWIRDYNIRPRGNMSTNQLAFAIQTSIYKNGIRGRKYVDKVNRAIQDLVAEELEVQLAEVITNDLVEAFKV